MTFQGTFHHVGLACRRIEDEVSVLICLGYTSEGPAVEDAIQKVRVQFYVGPGPRIELIEPTAADSPIHGMLKRETKLYHLAYEVPDLDQAIHLLQAQAFRPVGPSAPAAAFGMRPMIFMMSNTLLFIELIEAET